MRKVFLKLQWLRLKAQGVISVKVEYPQGSQKCSICEVFDHSEKDCKKSKKIWVPVRKERVDAPTLDANQVRVEKVDVPLAQITFAAAQSSDHSISGQASTFAQDGNVPPAPQNGNVSPDSLQATMHSHQAEFDEDELPLGISQSGVKSSSRTGKENTPSGKKNTSNGSSNKFYVLADLMDEPQRVGGYPLRDRKQTQKAADSKNQYGKKKVGDMSGVTCSCPKT